jgi:tRNA pseudouridine55 synthase
MDQNEDAVFGLLNIDKPAGYTSHDIVDLVRKGTGVKKVGHAGTLDPAATGVLVLCMGAATRLSEYVMDHPKTYQAIIRVGQESETYDAEGEIIASDDTPITKDQFEAVLPEFRGHIQQIPPMYSAVKQGGEKLYEKARRGEEVERDPRDVSIFRLQLESFVYPEAIITVRCSPGTYIRSLAHDIGQALGVGARLDGLIRVASGENFTTGNAVPLRKLQTAMQDGTWQDHLMSPREGLSQLPYIELNNQQEDIVRNGGKIQLGISNAGPIQAWTDEGVFVAIMSRGDGDDESAVWKPNKVFNVQ